MTSNKMEDQKEITPTLSQILTDSINNISPTQEENETPIISNTGEAQQENNNSKKDSSQNTTSSSDTLIDDHKLAPTPIPAITLKQKSPIALRLLKDMDEEIWLSGSELRTDNSSTEDDESKHRRPQRQRRRSLRCRRRSQLKPVVRNATIHLCPADAMQVHDLELDAEIIGACGGSQQYLQVEQDDDVQWRPKRGSITLPGLVAELDRVEINT